MENTKELELIKMVQHMQAEQKEYWRLKRIYGNAGQQLDKCKALEKELTKYCAERLKAITSQPEIKQQTLFT